MVETFSKKNALIALCFILLFCFSFYLFVWHPYRTPLADFRVYYEAALRLSQGQNIYDHIYQVQQFDGRYFKQYYFYPPFLAYGLSFFVQADYDLLKLLWCSLNFLALLGAVAFLAAIKLPGFWGNLSPWTRFVVIFFFAVCFEPVYWGVRLGQVNSLVLFLLCAYLFFWQSKRYFGAGTFLAIAALLKVSPLTLLVVPLVFRRWSVFSGFLSICALAGLSLCFVPPPVYSDFFLPFGQVFAGTLERHYVFNFAPDKALLGILGLDEIVVLRWLVRFAVMAVSVWLILRLRNRGDLSELGAQGVAICAMIILAPTFWAHHLTWTFIPLYILSTKPCVEKKPISFHLMIVVALYLAFSQSLLLHTWIFRQIPALLNYSALFPTVALIVLAVLICTAYAAEQN